MSPVVRSMRMSSGSSRLKTEAATGRVELHRRNAEIGQGAVHERRRPPIEHVVDIAVVGVDELHAIGPRRERDPGLGERVGIAIETDDPRRARLAAALRACPPSPTVQSTKMPPRSGCRYCSISAVMTGDVPAQMPNSESARASSSRVRVRAGAWSGNDRDSRRRDSRPVRARRRRRHRGGVAQANGDEHAALDIEFAASGRSSSRDRGSEASRGGSTAWCRAFASISSHTGIG